jgi:hypothetical protein
VCLWDRVWVWVGLGFGLGFSSSCVLVGFAFVSSMDVRFTGSQVMDDDFDEPNVAFDLCRLATEGHRYDRGSIYGRLV